MKTNKKSKLEVNKKVISKLQQEQINGGQQSPIRGWTRPTKPHSACMCNA